MDRHGKPEPEFVVLMALREVRLLPRRSRLESRIDDLMAEIDPDEEQLVHILH
jgi:hypothetical protein